MAAYAVEVSLQPNLFLDITKVFDLKQAAIACFGSRPDMQAQGDQITALDRLRAYSLPRAVETAEDFTLVRAAEISWSVARPLSSLKIWTERPSDRPLASVVIRSANRPELEDTLDSIATQT